MNNEPVSEMLFHFLKRRFANAKDSELKKIAVKLQKQGGSRGAKTKLINITNRNNTDFAM